MKKIYTFLILLLGLLKADGIYFTRSGEVSFFSSTPIEDIKAVNNQVTCVLDVESGKTSFRIPIRGFVFPNALMQEHFNENYMESEIYPNASFNGSIEDWSQNKISEGARGVVISGEMTIHGVTKTIRESGNIYTNNGKIFGDATFIIKLSEYDVKIPKLLRENIAEKVEVNIQLELNKK